MKHLKTFENWFTNLLKNSEYNHWEEFYITKLGKMYNYNPLIKAAEDGDFKKFRTYFFEYSDKLNDKTIENKNVLHYVVTGNGDFYEKKNMIDYLMDSNIDYTIKYEGETFYDLIKDNKLKKWFDKTYPNIVKKLNILKDTEKYNI